MVDLSERLSWSWCEWDEEEETCVLGFGHGVQFILREALRSGPRYRPRRLSPAKLPVDRMPVLFVHSNGSGVVEAWFVLSDWLLLTCVFLSRFQIYLSIHTYRCDSSAYRHCSNTLCPCGEVHCNIERKLRSWGSVVVVVETVCALGQALV